MPLTHRALALTLLLAGCAGSTAATPKETGTPCEDGDGDGVCDEADACLGDDASGDADGDHLCDDVDPCPTDNPDDVDADGVCNDEDQCIGDDATGDSDLDGTCDDTDPCPVDDPDDSDGDGVCNSEDSCPGEDDLSDADLDLVPDGCDVCDGFDDAADADADAVPDGCDACEGFDDALDLDGDGAPDACDACPEDNPDDANGDGLCDSTCLAWDESCGLLPFRGPGGGAAAGAGPCPGGWVATGVRTYLSDTLGTTQLLCRELLGPETLGEVELITGGWGEGGDGPLDARCTDSAADGVVVGQRIWSLDAMHGVGAVCQQLSVMAAEGGEHLSTWDVGYASVGDHALEVDLCEAGALVWSFDVAIDGPSVTAVAMRCGRP